MSEGVGPQMRMHVCEDLERDEEDDGLNEWIVSALAEPYALAIPD